ncbi:MAG TPA: hypothetical protein VGI19_18335 [Candidatus Cybelea sp.]|jgi:hypothetical protein
MYDRRRFLTNAATGIAGAQLAVTGLGTAHTSFASQKRINAVLR